MLKKVIFQKKFIFSLINYNFEKDLKQVACSAKEFGSSQDNFLRGSSWYSKIFLINFICDNFQTFNCQPICFKRNLGTIL